MEVDTISPNVLEQAIISASDSLTADAGDVINAQALRLLGESGEEMGLILERFYIKLGLQLQAHGLCDEKRRDLTIATGNVICQRIAEWHAIGIGHA
jgi:hypothetical protein